MWQLQWRKLIEDYDFVPLQKTLFFLVNMKRYVIEYSFEFRYAKNHKDKVVAEYSKKGESYNWKIFAKKMKGNDFFYIKWFIKEHTCKSVLREQTSKHSVSNLKSRQRGIDV